MVFADAFADTFILNLLEPISNVIGRQWVGKSIPWLCLKVFAV